MSHRVIGMTEGDYEVAAECDTCHTLSTLTVPGEQWMRWKNGMLIQNAIPCMSADNRELLISGTCGECFSKMWAEDDDE